jgi:cytochrome P450
MGQDFNCLRDPHTPLIKAYRRVLSPNGAFKIVWAIGFVPPKWLTALLPISSLDGIHGAVSLVRQTALDMIHQKKLQLQNEKTPSRSDFISLSLSSNSFTSEQLVNQIMTLLASGNDTTSASFSWAIYALARHPSIQSSLRDEIRSRIPPQTADTVIDATLIDNLPYLRATLNEVLRFYPTIPMIFKLAARDTSILGHFIPKGTAVLIHPTAINFSRELWGDDAEQFKPERWLEANGGGAKSNYAFMSFGHGPTGCIGQNLARAELSILLARFVGRFAFEMMTDGNGKGLEEVKSAGPMTAKPVGGINIRFRVVEGWS